MKNQAPIFVDTFSLCEWLLQRLERESGVLPRVLCENALQLLEVVVLALKGRSREVRIEEADERLIILRMQLRLAAATGWLDERQLVFALDHVDRIGRQLGGWQRSLDTAS